MSFSPNVPHMSPSHPSHILYQNPSQTLSLIDVPQSIEQAQSLSSQISLYAPGHSCSLTCSTSSTNNLHPRIRKLISCAPLAEPYPSLEPKSQKAIKNLPDKDIDDLLLERYVELSLAELREAYRGEKWCLPRVVGYEEKDAVGGTRKRKRKRVRRDEGEIGGQDGGDVTEFGAGENLQAHNSPYPLSASTEVDISKPILFSNPNSTPLTISTLPSVSPATLPPHSTLIHGALPHTLSLIPTPPPKFPFILLDPPWPNRSAHRHSSYQTTPEIHSLLSSLPLQELLSPDGYIAVWLTNKPSFRSLVLDPGGLFDQWGVRLVEEWIWIKVTENGEPVTEIAGRWRKPWERVVVGRVVSSLSEDGRREEGEGWEVKGGVKRRIIAGVPDIHSRKPNLRCLFGKLLGKEKEKEGYSGMEIFARNLTAGWWGVGDEVLKFQMEECWVDGDADVNANCDADEEL